LRQNGALPGYLHFPMPCSRPTIRLASACLALLFALLAGPGWAQVRTPYSEYQAATASAPGASAVVTPAPSALPPIQQPAPANPYGLRALWQQGDPVARITLLILVLMSVASWYVLITKLVAQSRLGGQGRAANQHFWKAETLHKGVDTLQQGSPYRFIAESALEATRRHDGLIGQVDLNTWVAQSIERAVGTVHGRTQEGLAILATVGSTAPFVGLFGTVWGIYNALVRIGASGQASIDRVAGPVGEALIMTAIGLAVAVPAVLGYNWLVRRNRVAMDTVRAFGSDLHTVVLANNARRA
jgi:biopolymer transport protein ExbB